MIEERTRRSTLPMKLRSLPRHRHGDDLVPRLEVEGGDCGMDRRRAKGRRDGVIHPALLGGLFLQGVDLRAAHAEGVL